MKIWVVIEGISDGTAPASTSRSAQISEEDLRLNPEDIAARFLIPAYCAAQSLSTNRSLLRGRFLGRLLLRNLGILVSHIGFVGLIGNLLGLS